GDDTYDGTFQIVPVDLDLSSVTVIPSDRLWAGEPAAIFWRGSNRTGTALLGDWIDAVYLSTDDKWDIRDIRLALVPHTGGLMENQTYRGSATVVIPGVLPGAYYILVRADVANQEKEGPDEADNLVNSGPLPLLVHELAVSGSPNPGTLTPTDPADYYAI